MIRRPRPAPAQLADDCDPRPVKAGETFITYTEPMRLVEVHPLRRNACLSCGEVVGGRPVRFVQIVFATEPACECGTLTTVSQLVCASHGEPKPAATVAKALNHMRRFHGGYNHLASVARS